MEHVADNWYETFFQGINCEVWENAIFPEITIKEVDFLLGEMNLEKGSHILDIPCGAGRHAIEIAKRGYLVTGVDISDTFMRNLTNRINDEGLLIRAIQADILSVDLNEKFSGALCFGNSFGYFNYECMKIFIEKVASNLVPGAQFIINSGMVAESILSNFLHYSNYKTYTIGNIMMEVSNYYNTSESFMVSKLHYTKDGQEEDHTFKHYVFTMAEIKRLLLTFGLRTIATYSSTDKAPYKLGDQQVYIISQKE